MITRLFGTISVALFVLWAASSACAVSYPYVFDKTDYEVPIGGTVDVSVYLREVGATVFRDSGLIGAGVQVRFDDAPQPSSPAKVQSTADVLNISDFELVWSTSAEPSAGHADILLGTWGYVYGTEVIQDVYQIPLATFRFSAGSVIGEVTHLRATDYNAGSGDVIFYDYEFNPVELDGLLVDAVATITTVAPEPGAMAMLIIAGLSILGYLRQSR